MPSLAVQATVDTQVSSQYPTKNYGGDAFLIAAAEGAPGSGLGVNQRIVLLHWNTPFPLGVTVLSAQIVLRQKGAATGGNRKLSLQRNNEPWQEGYVNWNNRPEGSQTFYYSPTQGNSSVDGREWAFDVTALMQSVADGAPWYGVRVKSDNAVPLTLYPRESGPDLAPTLVVSYSDAPDAPTQLSPSGSRSVSVPRPTFRFGFVDVAGETEMSGFQVQRHSSNSWSAPVYDSGEVVSSLPEFVPPADLPSGVDIWWRVRVRDSAGLWSDWSAGARFRRTPKPTVTITAPGVDGEFYTQNPVFTWTVSGGTQVRRQLALVDPDDSTSILWTTGVVTTAVGSVYLPDDQKRLLTPGESYRLVVRVWDDVAREAVPEEPTYVQVDRVITFQPSAAVAAPTDVSVEPVDSGAPFVLVSWSRSVAPDEFVILVDGRAVRQVVPADVSTGGTGYQVQLRGVPVRRDFTVSVAARVGDETSAGIGAASSGLEVKGLWLFSLEPDGPSVVLATDGPTEHESTEETAIFTPPGSPNLTLVTQRRGGVRGEIVGWIGPEQVSDWDALESVRAESLGMAQVDTVRTVRIWDTVRQVQAEGVAWGGDDTIRVEFSWAEYV